MSEQLRRRSAEAAPEPLPEKPVVLDHVLDVRNGIIDNPYLKRAYEYLRDATGDEDQADGLLRALELHRSTQKTSGGPEQVLSGPEILLLLDEMGTIDRTTWQVKPENWPITEDRVEERLERFITDQDAMRAAFDWFKENPGTDPRGDHLLLSDLSLKIARVLPDDEDPGLVGTAAIIRALEKMGLIDIQGKPLEEEWPYEDEVEAFGALQDAVQGLEQEIDQEGVEAAREKALEAARAREAQEAREQEGVRYVITPAEPTTGEAARDVLNMAAAPFRGREDRPELKGKRAWLNALGGAVMFPSVSGFFRKAWHGLDGWLTKASNKAADDAGFLGKVFGLSSEDKTMKEEYEARVKTKNKAADDSGKKKK